MTSAFLSGQNFWGGPTYLRDDGYVLRDDHGSIDHQNWTEMESEGDKCRLGETLAWLTRSGEVCIAEERRIVVDEIDPARGYWCLDLSVHLSNAWREALLFGSPTTNGRPQAGYGGLFWRGPRSFLGGRVLGPDGLEGPEAMGRRAPWLAFTGQHDGPDRCSTLVFVDHPENPRYPTKWFVRSEPYACVAWSFMFDEEYVLEPGQGMAFRHLLVVATGDPGRERIEEHVRALVD